MEKQYALQSMIFDFKRGKDENFSLLFHRGKVSYETNEPVLKNNEMISFDTYFNMLYTGAMRKYLCVEKIAVAMTLCGKGRAELIGVDQDNSESLIAEASFDYKIEKGDLCYQLFTEHGFVWGGEWPDRKDYQHFEIPDEVIDKWYP